MAIPVSRPARHIAVVGDLAGTGRVIPCESIDPVIVDAGIVYEYCGTSDGIAVYKTLGELKELDAEQGGTVP